MKVAGRKNDGAWYRTNKWLRSPGMDPYRAQIAEDAELIEAYDMIVGTVADMSARTSVNLGNLSGEPMGAMSSSGLLIAHMNTGIPRTVWLGKLAWDVYTEVEVGEVYPRQFFASKSGGQSWLIQERVEGGAGDLAAKVHAGPGRVYWPRNAAAMAAAGIVIRDRFKMFMMAFRGVRDLYNRDLAVQGNPGGVADAGKDPEDNA